LLFKSGFVLYFNIKKKGNFFMKKSSILIVSILILGLIFAGCSVLNNSGVIPSDKVPPPPTISPITWTGQGVNALKCELIDTSEERNEDGWIHWVLNQAKGVTSAELVLNDSESYYDPTGDSPTKRGEYHFFTPYFDLETLTAYVNYNGSLKKSSQLVISDYCPGESGPTTYTLTMAVDPGGSGTATDQIDDSPYTSGTLVSILAVAEAGYEFDHWSATAGSFDDVNDPTAAFTMPGANATVTANFEASGEEPGEPWRNDIEIRNYIDCNDWDNYYVLEPGDIVQPEVNSNLYSGIDVSNKTTGTANEYTVYFTRYVDGIAYGDDPEELGVNTGTIFDWPLDPVYITFEMTGYTLASIEPIEGVEHGWKINFVSPAAREWANDIEIRHYNDGSNSLFYVLEPGDTVQPEVNSNMDSEIFVCNKTTGTANEYTVYFTRYVDGIAYGPDPDDLTVNTMTIFDYPLDPVNITSELTGYTLASIEPIEGVEHGWKINFVSP
jgi:hypothetical protein